MSEYKLHISIDNAGLTALSQAGQKVTIVKQTSVGKPVAWITFAPQQNNTVSWTEQYSVYSSTTNLQAGAVIDTSSVATAVGGSEYILNTSGFFDNGIPRDIDTNTYIITNNDPQLTIGQSKMITGGLIQKASISGNSISAPMCAVGILFSQSGSFTPIETIQVFVSSYANNGMVISSVVGSALTVTYTTKTEASIQYNNQQSTFVSLES